MNKRLERRVAVVTGAGQGVGRGIARRLALEGATVVVAEINRQSGEQVAGECSELGGRGVFIHTDVLSKESGEQCLSLIHI